MTTPATPTSRPAGPGGPAAAAPFTPYQKLVVAVLAFIQFTLVLDFMILSPLGAFLLPELGITTAQFGLVVSVYAFSAGVSGILAAGFADRFDRKRLLLFFYGGFVLGTFLCGIAPGYRFLLAARMVTGLFGGVLGSISFAIIADLFPYEARGRVMGFVQTAFAASQVLGIPFGLYLTNHLGWHAPFLMIVAVSTAVGVLIVLRLRPIDAHLAARSERNPVQHLLKTVTTPRYTWGFAATTLLATGGFMLMPLGSAFTTFNLGIPMDKLPLIYTATGLTSILAGPLLGRLSDSIGKYAMFCFGTLLGMAVVVYYCRMGLSPLWQVIAVNMILFVAITGRMVSAQALNSAVPDPKDRGAYMAVNASLQQLSGGVASMAAGLIVVQTASGRLEHYDTLGYVVAVAMAVALILMYRIHLIVRGNSATAPAGGPGARPGAPAPR